jgi:Family of unknown function (DUF6399)
MTLSQPNPDRPPRPESCRADRAAVAQTLRAFHHPNHEPLSQRAFARQQGVPRTTLQHWLQRTQHPDADPDFATFCESPAGQHFLRRLVLALHLVFHLEGTAGIRRLGRFLELTGLDAFVAASYGAQQALAVTLQESVVQYGLAERSRLAATMPARTLSVCLDENFHQEQLCLVGIEPESGFVLLEEYHQRRDGETWTRSVQQAVQGLPVTVIQVTSDQAKGLIACAEEGLEAHHTPDLFHVQRELSKATALALERQRSTAATAQEQAATRVAATQQRQQDYQEGPRPPGRPPPFAADLRMAAAMLRQATTDLETCQQRQEQARQAIRGLADGFHPFDTLTGQPRAEAVVEQELTSRVAEVEQVVASAALGATSQAAVTRVRTWLVPLVVTVGWFWELVDLLLERLRLSAVQEQTVREQLLPGLYWQREASRGRDAEQRRQRRELSTRLLAAAWSSDSPLGSLSLADRESLERVCREAVGLFQRSSSCVEGRNGRLSLLHHGHGPLSAGRLQALTVVHNYLSRRADGTTAAERFFGSQPCPVFEWLLERLPDLPRPAQRRKTVPEVATTAA